ncbi:MAG: hypothetical protein JNN06_14615 [Gemmobacter sp.]|uniref:hypothetical protein n=1 Tax=Gemmobacter sp. TaxID=1898957 RepID=UPI001A43EBA3|nr:hypothetical protein [Gemmobacter sp.]MBL8563505.1 hypothetical protein [Gemmobacter sp.]
MTHLPLSRLPLCLALAGLLAATPLTLRHDPVSGAYALDHSTAEARKGRGSDDRHNDDRQRDDRGGRKKHDSPPSPPGPVTVAKVERSATELEVRYSDGTREEIDAGRYERKDASGRTVEERPATAADIARLSAL